MPDTIEQWLDQRVPDRPDGQCWLWQGCVNKAGYGITTIDKRQWRAHRLAWTAWVGPIPDGLTIDHVKARGCTSRLCCNPAHLELVTGGINSMRGEGPPARNARKTECVNGHEFTEENTVYRKSGGRGCRACQREHSNRYREVHRERYLDNRRKARRAKE